MLGIVQLGGVGFAYRTQRPQHLAKRLSKHYRLAYIEPFLGGENIAKIGDDLYVTHLQGNGIARQVAWSNPETLAHSLESMIGKLGIDEPILWFDFPYWSPILTHLKPYKVVYNCMDAYRGFSDLAIHKEQIDRNEKFLFSKSDLVIATAKGLYDKASRYAKNVILVPNGCELSHFDVKDIERPAEFPYGNIVGYVGAIAEWFDQKAVAYAADSLPYWNFVLIGNVSVNVDMLKCRKNIYLLGEQSYSKIPTYIHHFDVAIIPFDTEAEVVKDCNPVKFYEFSAAGKPIVASPLPELLKMRAEGRYCRIAWDVDGWSTEIKQAQEDARYEGFVDKQKLSVTFDDWTYRVSDILGELRKIGC